MPYKNLSDLFSELDIAVKQRCKRLARRLENSEDVTVIIDSTGLSFDQASQWYDEKYGRRAEGSHLRCGRSDILQSAHQFNLGDGSTDLKDLDIHIEKGWRQVPQPLPNPAYLCVTPTLSWRESLVGSQANGTTAS
jgi:hypothetical protein